MLVVEVDGAVVVVVFVVVVVLVVVDVDVDVVVVVVLLQDAKTIDITIRQVSAIQIVPLFIALSFYFQPLITNHLIFATATKPICFDTEYCIL